MQIDSSLSQANHAAILTQNTSVHKTDLFTKCAAILKRYPSRPALASAIISGKHIYSSRGDVPFCRSLLWKTSLLSIETIRGSGNDQLPLFDMTSLRAFRNTFKRLVTNIGIPWHLLPAESPYYKSIESSISDNLDEDLSNLSVPKQSSVKQSLKKEPVSADNCPITSDSLPNSETDINVLTVIITDVERLFPEYPEMFIQNKQNKILMIEILYRYAKWTNQIRREQGKKELGYVQGMHELCGVIFAVLNVEVIDELEKKPVNDSVNNNFNSQISEFFSKKYLSHDIFAMFDKLMAPIIDKYFTSSGILRESIVFDLKLHHLDLGTPDQPGLATVLKENHIESQLWLTRWFRMILTREVGLAYAVRIWDGLIAYACVGAMSDTVKCGHDVSVLLPLVILILVLRIRTQILKSSVPCLKSTFDVDSDDDSEALSLLLHYPTNKDYSFSHSTSPATSFEYDEDNNRKPIMMHRRAKNIDLQTQNLITRAIKLPKMPSVLELFTDAASICGLSDEELNQIGPILINKYSNGDIYDVLKQVKKNNKTTSNFFNTVFKRPPRWAHPKSIDEKIAPEESSSMDTYRARLEIRLQKKVKDKLNKQ